MIKGQLLHPEMKHKSGELDVEGRDENIIKAFVSMFRVYNMKDFDIPDDVDIESLMELVNFYDMKYGNIMLDHALSKKHLDQSSDKLKEVCDRLGGRREWPMMYTRLSKKRKLS